MIVPGSANSLLLAQGATTGYNLTKSVRLRQDASAFFSRTPGSAGNQQKWTFSTWVKFGELGNNRNLLFAVVTSPTEKIFEFTFNANNVAYIWFYDAGAGTASNEIISTPVYRDPSAWYHFVLAVDTTQATASNRVKLYVNGTQVTSFSTAQYPAQNWTTMVNGANLQQIGKYGSGGGYYFDGYLAETIMVDGQQLTPSSFGENNADTGVWQPIRYTGTYGTNGYLLQYTDVATTSGSNAGLGKDFSGNGNYYATNNISVTAGSTYDSMTDVPTLTSATTANYCVLNPLDKNSSVSTADGNLQFTNSNSSWLGLRGTMGMTTGKWYVEYSVISSTYATFGIANASASLTGNAVTGAWGYGNDGAKSVNGTATGGWGATFTTGDIIGMAFDADAGTLAFYKNNVSQGNLVTGLAAGTYFPWIASYNSNTVANFGQRPFVYTPPTGYVALNTYNLPDSTIVAGNKYMDASLWTGNSVSGTNISGLNFQPDFVWLKSRTSADYHRLQNTNVGINKLLFSNATNAEQTNEANGYVSAVTSNGYTLTAGGSGISGVNSTGNTYVGWSWLASPTTSSNTNGSITSTVSVNPTAGFSVIQFVGNATAGATVGHGLGVAPQFYIVKSKTSATNWSVYAKAANGGNGQNGGFYLNSTSAWFSDNGFWNSTSATSTVLSLGSGGDVNANGQTHIIYAWTPIAGFSAFGSYTGNGSADGPFIYTGFRPKFVLYKRTDAGSSEDWRILDTTRDPYNLAVYRLAPNNSNAENSSVGFNNLDFLSNGFKIRSNSTDQNANGGNYIYAAFAENPFKNALAR